MALADYGFDTTLVVSDEDVVETLSLEEKKSRTGYMLRASQAAAGLKARVGRMCLSMTSVALGMLLVTRGDVFVSPETTGSSLIVPIGLYLVIAGVLWLLNLLRRPQELKVDKSNRTFQLIKRNWHGKKLTIETIRFEEVKKIEMIDHIASLDMGANAMNWDLGRIDITWRQDKVTPMLVGDVAELEPLVTRLRNEVGMA